MLADILGESKAIVDLRAKIARVARKSARVLILGEPGTGKELIARAIHSESGRRGDFVATNCGSMDRALAASELFGHPKGAFTGASSDQQGLFERANGGTVFLDEIGDLPLDVQAKLLRVLQQGEIERVGQRGKPIKVDVRVIAATNVDLATAVANKTFRQDLFDRLSAIIVRAPALRERLDDVDLLAAALGARHGFQFEMRADASALLRAYEWPGNVRELENVMQYLSVYCDSGEVDAALVREALDCRRPASAPPLAPVPVVAPSVPTPHLEGFDRVLTDVMRSQTVAFEAALERALGAVVGRLTDSLRAPIVPAASVIAQSIPDGVRAEPVRPMPMRSARIERGVIVRHESGDEGVVLEHDGESVLVERLASSGFLASLTAREDLWMVSDVSVIDLS